VRNEKLLNISVSTKLTGQIISLKARLLLMLT